MTVSVKMSESLPLPILINLSAKQQVPRSSPLEESHHDHEWCHYKTDRNETRIPAAPFMVAQLISRTALIFFIDHDI